MNELQNGRGRDGRFAPGNAGGPGNPHARRASEIRSALLSAISDQDVKAITAKLVEHAKAGDIDAAGFLFDRILGKPVNAVAAQVEMQGTFDPGERRARLAEIAARLGLESPDTVE